MAKKDFLTPEARKWADEFEKDFREWEKHKEKVRKELASGNLTLAQKRKKFREYEQTPKGYAVGYLLGGLKSMNYSILDGGKVKNFRFKEFDPSDNTFGIFYRDERNELGCFTTTTLFMKKPQIELNSDLTYSAVPLEYKLAQQEEQINETNGGRK